MIDSTRGWISLFLGIIATAFGLIPLLNNLGIIQFNLPFTIAGLVLAVLLIFGAIFLFMDSTHEDHLQWLSIIIGIILLVLGIVPILAYFEIIVDFTSRILAISIIKNIILIVAGILLMLGAGD